MPVIYQVKETDYKAFLSIYLSTLPFIQQENRKEYYETINSDYHWIKLDFLVTFVFYFDLEPLYLSW